MENTMEPLTVDEAREILAAAPVAHIGVIVDDEPYVTPMSFVLDGDRILFRTVAGRKLDGIHANPRVCVEVSRYDEGTGDWASVIVYGTAEEIEDEETTRITVEMLMSKYRDVIGSPLSRGGVRPIIGLPHVIEMKIERVSGMTAGRGWGHRTRPGRL